MTLAFDNGIKSRIISVLMNLERNDQIVNRGELFAGELEDICIVTN